MSAHNSRLCDIARPALEPGQQGFLDLAYTADGALIEDAARVWQFGLALVKAEGVGKTGVCLCVCVFVCLLVQVRQW
jgi:hypothetical protein